MAKIIAINNQKGGVAKTTTCLSLGACLAEMGYTVLLIDLDPQAHLTVSLGIDPKKVHRTVADVLLGGKSLLGVSRESSTFDLDIIPANQKLAYIDKPLYKKAGYEHLLTKRINLMDDDFYEYILIDCPPNFNTLTLNALTAADLLIVPVQCEYYAARSLPQIIKLTKMIKSKTNPCLNYQMLVTMYDRRNKVCQLILNEMQGQIGQLLYNTIIEVDTKIKESPAFGQPITQYAPDTRGAEQYRTLTKELIERWPTKSLNNNSQACSQT